jgi:hypothetical protein
MFIQKNQKKNLLPRIALNCTHMYSDNLTTCEKKWTNHTKN